MTQLFIIHHFSFFIIDLFSESSWSATAKFHENRGANLCTVHYHIITIGFKSDFLIYSSDLQSGNVLLRSDSSDWQHTVSLECCCYLHTGRNVTHKKFSYFVGQKFAMMELKVILASLLLNFNKERRRNKEEVSSDRVLE